MYVIDIYLILTTSVANSTSVAIKLDTGAIKTFYKRPKNK